MKPLAYHYTEVEIIQIANRFRLKSLKDLNQFAEQNQIAQILIVENKDIDEKSFALLYNNALFEHVTHGYLKLEDYLSAINNNFPDAESYYEAQEAGYKKYDDFKLVKSAGIQQRETLEKLKQTGFMKGFEDLKTLLANNTISPPATLPIFSDAYELYCFAIENGFTKYDQFKTAILQGFTNQSSLNVALELGFSDFTTYSEALKRGFRTHDELQKANELKIRDRQDLEKYLELNMVGDNANSFDQKLLLVILSKIEQGKKVSINKLYNYYINTINEYLYEDTKELPLWFTNEFQDKERFLQFLSSNSNIKKYGEYDHDGEFFQINQMKERHVVLDGSNVAHNSQGNGTTTPYLKNIILMVKYLRSEGFTEITIIVDSSLKKKLGDPEKLDELKELAEYLVAPSENPADIFIINYVKRTRCLLISNDLYRDWKIKDVWVAENIDFYKLSFMIKGNEVLLPDLK